MVISKVFFVLITELFYRIHSADKMVQICIYKCRIVIFGLKDVTIRLEAKINFSSWFAVHNSMQWNTHFNHEQTKQAHVHFLNEFFAPILHLLIQSNLTKIWE